MNPQIKQAMKEAIQKAIEGGWLKDVDIKSWEYNFVIAKFQCEGTLGDFEYSLTWEEITSKPLFWQALGKAMGWATTNTACNKCGVPFNGWKGHMHRFTSHLAEGKDADSYFNELLK